MKIQYHCGCGARLIFCLWIWMKLCSREDRFFSNGWEDQITFGRRWYSVRNQEQVFVLLWLLFTFGLLTSGLSSWIGETLSSFFTYTIGIGLSQVVGLCRAKPFLLDLFSSFVLLWIASFTLLLFNSKFKQFWLSLLNFMLGLLLCLSDLSEMNMPQSRGTSVLTCLIFCEVQLGRCGVNLCLCSWRGGERYLGVSCLSYLVLYLRGWALCECILGDLRYFSGSSWEFCWRRQKVKRPGSYIFSLQQFQSIYYYQSLIFPNSCSDQL